MTVVKAVSAVLLPLILPTKPLPNAAPLRNLLGVITFVTERTTLATTPVLANDEAVVLPVPIPMVPVATAVVEVEAARKMMMGVRSCEERDPRVETAVLVKVLRLLEEREG